jgi:hypothetical protein
MKQVNSYLVYLYFKEQQNEKEVKSHKILIRGESSNYAARNLHDDLRVFDLLCVRVIGDHHLRCNTI